MNNVPKTPKLSMAVRIADFPFVDKIDVASQSNDKTEGIRVIPSVIQLASAKRLTFPSPAASATRLRIASSAQPRSLRPNDFQQLNRGLVIAMNQGCTPIRHGPWLHVKKLRKQWTTLYSKQIKQLDHSQNIMLDQYPT